MFDCPDSSTIRRIFTENSSGESRLRLSPYTIAYYLPYNKNLYSFRNAVVAAKRELLGTKYT